MNKAHQAGSSDRLKGGEVEAFSIAEWFQSLKINEFRKSKKVLKFIDFVKQGHNRHHKLSNKF